VSTPTGSCCGATTVRASRVGQHQQRAAGQHAAGSSTRWSLPMARRTRCGTIRPMKPTAAGGGHRNRGEQRRQHIDAPRSAPPARRASGHQVAARQQVEVARQGIISRKAQRQHGQRRPGRAGMRQVAHQPEQHAAQLVARALERIRCHRRAAAGGDDDAGQQQARLRPAPSPRARPNTSSMAPARRRRRRRGDPAAAAGRTAWQQRAHRRAAGDAEHVGVGQGVAQQHLHQRAGQRQQAAAGEGGQRARQAQAAHHFRRHAATAVAEQARPDVARRERRPIAVSFSADAPAAPANREASLSIWAGRRCSRLPLLASTGFIRSRPASLLQAPVRHCRRPGWCR
jgi:hypothetical protein